MEAVDEPLSNAGRSGIQAQAGIGGGFFCENGEHEKEKGAAMKHRFPTRLAPLTLSLILLAGCGGGPAMTTETAAPPDTDFSDTDFSASVFKHVNNGGITDSDVLPYNVDVITGATVTVEGPAVAASIPLSVRELENRDAGLVRGIYTDAAGPRVYEGMDLRYLLYDMAEGDNGIRLTETAYRVELKNSNRAAVAVFPLETVLRASADGRPILLAYGVGSPDGTLAAPFVFDAPGEGEHSLGYVPELDNEDGCIRLVYDRETYGGGQDGGAFSNVAYVYVCEETEPGFKHTGAETFNTSRYTDYILTFRGAALGCEMDLTVRQLEDLVVCDPEGIVPGGIGYADEYSLANNAYWYVNTYEGLDLYKLLLYLGMDSAEDMGLQTARTTLVQFTAADGAASNEAFSIDTLSYPDAFGFYNKNAADHGDGSYVPTNADLVDTGYPVLLAYGVNGYPYTIQKSDPAYLSGLSNSGGPFRVVFGKTQYNHANGSNQVQYLSELIVGEDVLYNTHRYTPEEALHALAGQSIALHVQGEDGGLLMDREITVGELEDLIYGEGVSRNEKRAAQVKDSYEIPAGGGYETHIFEGVRLEYLLMDALGLPGTNGTVTFSNESDSLALSLEELFRSGCNASLGRENMPSLLAFAKNGTPLTAGAEDAGYVAGRALNPFLASDPPSYPVDNRGGPVALILPSPSLEESAGQILPDVREITISLSPDAYAHTDGVYRASLAETVLFTGPGLREERTLTLEELEGRQRLSRTLDFVLPDEDGTAGAVRYRGIPVYALFTETGIRGGAGDVTVRTADGTETVVPLSALKQSVTDDAGNELCAILAYGIGTDENDRLAGLPLTASVGDPGYVPDAGNDGGPLALLIPREDGAAERIDHVTALEVSAREMESWSHRMSDVYEEFLDAPFTLVVKNDENEGSMDFSLAQLESMEDLIVREDYTVLDLGQCEGLDIWKLICRAAGSVPGIDDPISITAYAADGYKNDLLSAFSIEGFRLGVADENGERKPLLLCYAINGYPLVDSESHEGYTGLAGNGAGPLRVVAETNQGGSVKYCTKIVVTLKGTDPIDIVPDADWFGE